MTPARSEESADLLRDRIQVDVVEAGSGRQTGHGAHLREKKKPRKATLFKQIEEKCVRASKLCSDYVRIHYIMLW